MGFCVLGGANLQCSFGVAPSVLNVLPVACVLSTMPVANITSNIPLMNIMPFGMCSSMVNPMVLAATVAALGVLTPMPCIPVTPAPWAPGSPTVMIGGMPALNNTCKLNCIYGGIIQIINPGTTNICVK